MPSIQLSAVYYVQGETVLWHVSVCRDHLQVTHIHLITCVGLQGPSAGNTHTHTHTRQTYSEELLRYEWFVYKLRCMSSVELIGLYWSVIGMCIDFVHIVDLLESRREHFLLSNLLIVTVAVDASVGTWCVSRLRTETRCEQVSHIHSNIP